jgi:hypothetical protein
VQKAMAKQKPATGFEGKFVALAKAHNKRRAAPVPASSVCTVLKTALAHAPQVNAHRTANRKKVNRKLKYNKHWKTIRGHASINMRQNTFKHGMCRSRVRLLHASCLSLRYPRQLRVGDMVSHSGKRWLKGSGRRRPHEWDLGSCQAPSFMLLLRKECQNSLFFQSPVCQLALLSLLVPPVPVRVISFRHCSQAPA